MSRSLLQGHSIFSVVPVLSTIGLAALLLVSRDAVPAAGATSSFMLAAAEQIGAWSSKPPLPSPRAESAVVELGGKVYVIGGYGANDLRVNTVFVHDIAAGTWSTAANYPGPPLDHAGGAAFGGKIYLIGGMTDWPGPSVNTVYVYDPANNTWSQKANMPKTRGAMGVAVINGKIYAAGGLSDFQAVKDLAVYDPLRTSGPI